MWSQRSHAIDTLVEVPIGSKGIRILWNNNLEFTLKEIRWFFSTDTRLDYPDRKIPFTVHTGASYKQLGSVISLNN